MKKVIISAIMLVSSLSFSSLFCDVNDRDNKHIGEHLSYLKIKNDKIYKAYLLVDEDGKVLISDNENEALPLASLTKLMTAMVVLDNIVGLNSYTYIDKDEASIPYGTRLKADSYYKIKDLLYFMLMMSSNSAAVSLANAVGPDFIDLMNKKARELGLNSASFCTANGLPPKYTKTCLDIASAMDMYKISKYALSNYPIIREITSTKEATVNNIKLLNTNELLRTNQYIVGTKTGYHKIAGYNISILIDKNNKKYYEIILGSDSEKNRKMLSEAVLKDLEGE